MSTLTQGYDRIGPMLVVRAMTDADVDAVAEVHVRTWQAAYAGIMPAAVLDALDPAVSAARRRERKLPDGARTVVADEDGQVVGFASFGPYRVQGTKDDYDYGYGEVYAIYVRPGHWGTGAGRALMAAAREGLAGYPEFRLWVLEDNHRARRFYEKAGLVPDGEREFYTPPGAQEKLAEIRYSASILDSWRPDHPDLRPL